MKGLGMILRSLGVNFSDEHIRQIEIMIPQIPSMLQKCVEAVNITLAELENRQSALETKINYLVSRLDQALQSIEKCNDETLINIQVLRSQFQVIERELDHARTERNLQQSKPNGTVTGIDGTGGSVASAGTCHNRTTKCGT
jgi:septation ring formation regulator EzrA